MKPFYRWTSREILDYLLKLDQPTKLKALGGAVGGILFVIFIFGPAWVGRLEVQSKIRVLQKQIEWSQTQIKLEPKLLEDTGFDSFYER